MITLSCPSCGGEINFKSKTTVFAVCSYCLSNIVRHDVDLDLIGKMAELPADISPIQIGSYGKFEKNNIDVVGRVRVGWEDGFWNEWFLYFSDGREAWLAEAQGDYAINFPLLENINVPPAEELSVGQVINLTDNKPYRIDDIKEIHCAGSEGELPFKAVLGRKSISVDLTHEDGSFACIDYSKEEGIMIYQGKYIELDELSLKNLREIEGW